MMSDEPIKTQEEEPSVKKKNRGIKSKERERERKIVLASVS
jgi:hypothetical protein